MMSMEEARVAWSKRIADWEASGLSGMAYCREHGLVYSQFGYWRRRFAREVISVGDGGGVGKGRGAGEMRGVGKGRVAGEMRGVGKGRGAGEMRGAGCDGELFLVGGRGLKSGRGRVSNHVGDGGFVAMAFAGDGGGRECGVRVRLACGVELVLDGDFDEGCLVRVVRALGGVGC